MAAEPRGAKRDLNRVPLPYSGVEGEGSGAQAPSAGGRARSVAPICARIARQFGSLANGVEPRSWLCDIPDGRTYPCDGRAHEFGNRAAARGGRHRQWRDLCARRARHRPRLRRHARHFRAVRRYSRLCGADAWRASSASAFPARSGSCSPLPPSPRRWRSSSAWRALASRADLLARLALYAGLPLLPAAARRAPRGPRAARSRRHRAHPRPGAADRPAPLPHRLPAARRRAGARPPDGRRRAAFRRLGPRPVLLRPRGRAHAASDAHACSASAISSLPGPDAHHPCGLRHRRAFCSSSSSRGRRAARRCGRRRSTGWARALRHQPAPHRRPGLPPRLRRSPACRA